MNCDKFQRDILLNSNGELSDKAQQTLSKHLAGCDSCRNYRDQVVMEIKTVEGLLPGGEPSALVMANIRDKAQEELGKHRLILFSSPIIPLLATAAACAIILTGIWTAIRPCEGSARIDELGAILSMTSSDEWEETQNGDGANIKELAEQLLQIEGFADESLIDLDFADWSPDPTALQLRNTRAIPSKRYG